MTEEPHLRARFGENEISDPRLRAHVTFPENDPATAALIIPKELMNTANVDSRSPVEIVANVAGEEHQLFTGFVDEATSEGSEVRLNLTTQTQIMSETRMGGLGYARVPPQEVMWAVTSLGGYLPENIIIEGWEPGPTEVIEVATVIEHPFYEFW